MLLSPLGVLHGVVAAGSAPLAASSDYTATPGATSAGRAGEAAVAESVTDASMSGASTSGPESGVELGILAELRAGRHREALRLCAEHHGATLGRLSMAMLGSQAEAEEITQETLLTAYQSFAAFRAQGSVLAWLCGIARKKCLKQLEHRRREAAQSAPLVFADEPSAEEQLHDKQQAARARAALEAVRPTEREALLLRYAAELSFEEVAQACDVEPALARKRVSRGLLRLRKALQDSDLVLAERAKA